MQRRVKIPKPNPLTFASRSLTAQTAGNVKELEDEFKADKLIKDTKMSTIEADINSFSTRIVTLENGGGSGSGDGSGSMSSETVNWTNISEINLSGEKITNGDFSQLTTPDTSQTSFTSADVGREIIGLQDRPLRGFSIGDVCTITNVTSSSNSTTTCGGGGLSIGGLGSQWTWNETAHPTNWVLRNGTLDADQLALGRVDGLSGAVAIQQMFSSPLAIGTKIIVKIERYDTNTGSVGFRLVKADGNMHGNVVQIPPSPGFIEYTVADHAMAGIRLDTLHGTRSISSISVFQGAISGGSVQVYAGGTIEKISGSSGYNAGASSVQAIGGNSDGYVQFQLAQAPLRVGLTYSDVDFENINPFRLVLNYNGSGWVGATQALTAGSVSAGDFFRIRHYSADNTIHFQKRQAVGDGQDYVTFHTHPTLTNGSDLYVDTSLFNVGSRLNDVTIVR